MNSRRRNSGLWFAPLLVGTFCLAGCGTVPLEVPPGRSVRLLHQDEKASVRVEKTIWYYGWGWNPLTENSTAPIIEEHDLKEVRFTVTQSFWDTVISTVTSFVSITRRTLIVEGNS